ncbi:MAG: DNRLRE domain-containing protein [Chloroflexi bacterium]|nr:DNRLRE domain-containing protein [Chloroflexota bacterium]
MSLKRLLYPDSLAIAVVVIALASLPIAGMPAWAGLGPTASTYLAYANHDTYIVEKDSTTNYGVATTLDVGYTLATGSMRTLVSFDISPLPPNISITNATLALYVSGTSGTMPRNISARQVTSAWDEYTVTWNTQPGTSGTSTTASVSGTGTVTWDVTSMVRDWYDGTAANHGIMLSGPSTPLLPYQIAFSPREYSLPSEKPQLTITYNTAPTNTPTSTPTTTPLPTHTPFPTKTATPTPTDTPLPTRTPFPTQTATPTLTPAGSSTPFHLYLPMILHNAAPSFTQIPPLYFFYVDHTHLAQDYSPYTDSSMLVLDTAAVTNTLQTIEAMAAVFDKYGVKVAWEPSYGMARALCTVGGTNHIFRRLANAGHEVDIIAHGYQNYANAAQVLNSVCGIASTAVGGLSYGAASAPANQRQAKIAQGIQTVMNLGMEVGTVGMTENPLMTTCNNQIGVGNDMWQQTGNLMFPWRPDWQNQDVCADVAGNTFVLLDLLPMDIWTGYSGNTLPPPLTASQFANLRTWFDAALTYMETNRPTRIAAWGFVAHPHDFTTSADGHSPPDPTALAALDGFLAYVDQKHQEGRVVYAVPGEIASLAFTTATPTPTATPTGSHSVSANWGPEYQINRTSGPASGAVGRTLAVDSAGVLHAVWTDQSAGAYDVFYANSSNGGQTWSTAKDIANSSLPAYSPNIAVGPDDALHVIWNDRRDGGAVRLYYSRSTDGGSTWTSPRNISGANTRDVAGHSLSVDTKKRVHVAWHLGDPNTDTTPTVVYYARSTNNGSTWTTPRQLNTGSGHAAFPRFSVEGTNGDLLAIAWRDNRRDPDWDVYVAVSSDGGAHFTERVGRASPFKDWDPEATVDISGTIHLGVMTIHGSSSTIDYLRSTDQGQTWSTPVTLSEASSRFPLWAADNTHGVLWLFWKDEADFGTAPCTGANRCSDVAGKYSTDGGQSWSAMEFVTDLGDVEVKYPSPAVGPDGIPRVMWSDLRNGASQEAVFVRSRLTP